MGAPPGQAASTTGKEGEQWSDPGCGQPALAPWLFKEPGTALANPQGRGELEFSGACANWGALGRHWQTFWKEKKGFL